MGEIIYKLIIQKLKLLNFGGIKNENAQKGL